MKAIIFDMDGVILRSALIKTDAFADLFGFCDDETLNKILEHHIKNGGVSRFEKIKHYYKEFLGEELTEEQVMKKANLFQAVVLDRVLECPFVEGVKDFLEENYRFHNFFVISGTPKVELDIIMEKRDLEKYFITWYGAKEGFTKADWIRRILEQHNYDKKDVLYIGDSWSDYEACKETEINFLGRVDEISPFPPGTDFIKNFNGVKTWECHLK